LDFTKIHYLKIAIIKALLVGLALIASSVYAESDRLDTLEPKQYPHSNVAEPIQPVFETFTNDTARSAISGVESVHDYLSAKVQDSAESMDTWFADPDENLKSTRSKVTLYLPMTWYPGGETSTNLNFKVQLDLPKTNRKWSLFLTSFDEDDELENKSGFATRNDDNPSTIRIGASFFDKKTETQKRSIDTGLKFFDIVQPNLFIRFKDQYFHQLNSSWHTYTLNQFYQDTKDGFNWEGKQAIDYRLVNRDVFRSESRLTYWNNDDEWVFKQGLSYFTKLTPFKAHRYFAESNWVYNHQQEGFDSFAVGHNWREQLYSDWLFSELEPRFTWNEDLDGLSKPQFSLLLMLEMQFH
jgi:hypothetical protein